MTALDQNAVIHVDIVDKQHPAGWRIIGSCPESVSSSGGLHVYRGRNACVRDCASSDIIMTGRSLNDLLTKLANHTGLPVVLTDEDTWAQKTFTPAGVTR